MTSDRKRESMELSSILSKVIAADSGSEIYFFKGKFQIFLLEKLFAFPGPLGDLFKKGIIVCGGKEESKSLIKRSSGSSGSLDPNSSVSELDVTGSPLECVFDSMLLEEGTPIALCAILKNPKISSNVYPLPVPDALHIVDLCNLCQADALREVPLFVIWDGKDPENTILTGIFRKEKNSRFKLTSKGPYSKKDEFPTFQSIKKKHQSFYNSTMETSAYAHYDIVDLPVSTGSTSVLKPCKEGALAIKCRWNNVSTLLQMPTADASCELLVLSVSGDDQSGAFARYRELKLVQALADSLRTGKVAWPNTESDGKLYEKLIDLVNGNDSGIRQKTQQNEIPANASDFESSFEACVTGNRKDMDFTDQLWTILTECTSYNELTNALEFVFKELRNASVSPVFQIYRNNTTAIAKFVQGMRKGGSAVPPSLESTKPIQLLLEIGVEKLQKDYLMLLVGLELCPYESIKPYLQPDKLSDEAVNCLAKLHSVLELTVLCWTNLSLPKLVLNSVVRTSLKHYLSLPKVDPSYIFRFPISMLHMRTTIEKHEPTEWQASFLSKCNGYDHQTVLHLSAQPFLQNEPGVKKRIRLPSSPLMMRNAYYCTTAVLVQDNFPVSIRN